MGGLAGTALMLLEASGVGATLWLDAIPRPPRRALGHLAAGLPQLRLPAVGAAATAATRAGARSPRASIAAAVVGRVDASRRLTLAAGGERARLWDFARAPLTGFGAGARR